MQNGPEPDPRLCQESDITTPLDTLIPVAEGAIGRVYKARDPATGELVAVKILHRSEEAQIERLKREAAAQQRLDHPNICRVRGIETDEDGQWRLLMDYVPGSTLAEELDRLPLDRRIAVLATVCDALAYAHAAGILHRDLKPANILLRESERGEWTPVVADFGLALGADDPALTTTGEILGSPAYMSPEQARGDSIAVGPASDVFSIGCMLYEALTGRPPFQGATISDSLDRLLNAEAPHPRRLNPHAPEPLCRIALQCLEQNPAHRYRNVADVAVDLRRWARQQTVGARRYNRFYRLRRVIRRNPIESAAVGLASIAIIGLLAWGAGTARTAAVREASAATLGTALADVRGRMTIARLAPAHDIGIDRGALRKELEDLESSEAAGSGTADLLRAALAEGYLEIGDLERAEAEAARAIEARRTPATRAAHARTLLARYAATAAALTDVPPDQRAERLADARKTLLEPAQELIRPLAGTAEEPAEALARLAIIERRFEEAEDRIVDLEPDYPQDYTPELLRGLLEMARGEAALKSADRERAAETYRRAQSRFEAVTEIGRSDPRPRQLACRAARGVLRATMDRGGPIPESIEALSPGCVEVVAVDPGNPESHATQAAAWNTLAEAHDGVNAREAARRAIEKGIAAVDTALARNPQHAEALEQKARLHRRMAGLAPEPWPEAQAQFDAGAEAAERLRMTQPESTVGQLLTAVIERDRARHFELFSQPEAARQALARAQTAFDDLLERTPDSIVALNGAALNAVFQFYEYRHNDTERAVAWMERAIALQDRALAQDPDNVDLLFDQGANYGDLWFYRLLTPEAKTETSREALFERAMTLLGRIRELAPQQPSGYTQPLMILLSGADHQIDQGLNASASLDRAMSLLRAAERAGVTLERNIPAWLQQARVRNVLAQGGNAAPVFADAFKALRETEVDESDRAFQHTLLLELTGPYQRWLRENQRPADPERFEHAHAALEALLANDRRPPMALCGGALVFLEETLAGLADDRTTLERSEALFEECLEANPDFQNRYGPDLEQVRALLAEVE